MAVCQMDEDRRKEYWACLALRHCRGLGARTVCRLLSYFGSAYAAVQEHEQWPKAGVGENKAEILASNAWRPTAQEEWNKARQTDTLVIFWKDPEYPQLLRRIPDAPALLYCRGDLTLLHNPAIAVVGSRKASKHGLAVAEHMARSLSACGLTIVSGMALGIDRVAHEAALRAVGRSIGVLGTGIDMLYPRQNHTVFESMVQNGLLISEFAPGTPPQAGNFPIRNRLISGLSMGVLVVEAAWRSGSLITARLALEQDREVYAVPGPALDVHCRGSQHLVRQGAHAVFCAEDVLRDLAEQLRPYGVTLADLPEDATILAGDEADSEEASTAVLKGLPCKSKETSRRNISRTDVGETALTEGDRAAQQLVSKDERSAILDFLRTHGPAQADELAVSVGLSAAVASATLIGLEMLGLVRRLPGARYEVVT